MSLEKFLVLQVYHMTPSRNRESILQYGLQPFGNSIGLLTYAPSVFVSLTPEALPWWLFGRLPVDIWMFCVQPHRLEPDKRDDSGNWYYLTESIPYYKLYPEAFIPDAYHWGMQTP